MREKLLEISARQAKFSEMAANLQNRPREAIQTQMELSSSMPVGTGAAAAAALAHEHVQRVDANSPKSSESQSAEPLETRESLQQPTPSPQSSTGSPGLSPQQVHRSSLSGAPKRTQKGDNRAHSFALQAEVSINTKKSDSTIVTSGKAEESIGTSSNPTKPKVLVSVNSEVPGPAKVTHTARASIVDGKDSMSPKETSLVDAGPNSLHSAHQVVKPPQTSDSQTQTTVQSLTLVETRHQATSTTIDVQTTTDVEKRDAPSMVNPSASTTTTSSTAVTLNKMEIADMVDMQIAAQLEQKVQLLVGSMLQDNFEDLEDRLLALEQAEMTKVVLPEQEEVTRTCKREIQRLGDSLSKLSSECATQASLQAHIADLEDKFASLKEETQSDFISLLREVTTTLMELENSKKFKETIESLRQEKTLFVSPVDKKTTDFDPGTRIRSKIAPTATGGQYFVSQRLPNNKLLVTKTMVLADETLRQNLALQWGHKHGLHSYT